ncbi:hypothetical protein MMC18_001147 [Xylographa bjoerkii]|nr:hypothetical protein [Xylographa bjoerkii]
MVFSCPMLLLLLVITISTIVHAKFTIYQNPDAHTLSCTPSQSQIILAALAEGQAATKTTIAALHGSMDANTKAVYAELFGKIPTSQVTGTSPPLSRILIVKHSKATLDRLLTAAADPTYSLTIFCNENHITKLPDPYSGTSVWTDTAWQTSSGKFLSQVQTSDAEAGGWKNTDAQKTCSKGLSAYTTGINTAPGAKQLDPAAMHDSSHIMLCDRFWVDVPGGNPDRKTLSQWKAKLPEPFPEGKRAQLAGAIGRDDLKAGEIALEQMRPRSLAMVHEPMHTEKIGGKEANGDGKIQDFAYGYPECAKLVTAGNAKESPLENADSFTMLVQALNLPGHDWSGGKTSISASSLKGKSSSQAVLDTSVKKANRRKRGMTENDFRYQRNPRKRSTHMLQGGNRESSLRRRYGAMRLRERSRKV